MSDRQRALDEVRNAADRAEHHAHVVRLRRAALVGVVLWPLFGVLDWYIVTFVYPGRLWWFLLMRVIGLVALGIGVLVTYSPRPPGPRTLAFFEWWIVTSLAVLVSLGCVELRGIDSPLATGIVLILLVRAAVLAQHWKHSLPTVVSVVVQYPLTLLVASHVSPELAAEFYRAADLGGMVINLAFMGAAAASALYGGHVVWALRRQVYESRSFGQYRLDRRIGKGGMGEVWVAHHHSLNRDVAVKIILPDDRRDPVMVARFEREVRATAELRHPNTVRVFDFGVTEDGLCYYAMELLEGQELSERVTRRGPLPAAEAVRFAWQTARALGEAHSRGIIHRDVKPENLFVARVGDEELIKVLDFGLAKLASDPNPQITQTGWTVGTPRWASPEIISGREADPRSDVYSLGGVLYFMVTGTPPFEQREAGALLAAHLDTAPESPSRRLGRLLPESLEEVILRCLAKDPGERFANGGELAVALEHAFAAASLTR